MARTVDSTKAGRDAFLARFADKRELSEHMREIAARRSRLIRLGKLMEEALSIMGMEAQLR